MVLRLAISAGLADAEPAGPGDGDLALPAASASINAVTARDRACGLKDGFMGWLARVVGRHAGVAERARMRRATARGRASRRCPVRGRVPVRARDRARAPARARARPRSRPRAGGATPS